jgi:flagellar hook-associated protein 2
VLSAITVSTKWNSVFDSSGTPANLADGDRITFSGTTRSGTEVSGSYTIDNVAEDSVQDFLSAIEETFGNEVTASINASGRIVVTDKESGNSSLSLTITP